jgi:predicted MPP superfamily phosphohydrolase
MTLFKVILMLGSILAIMIGAHLLVYKAIVHYLVIANTGARTTLLVCLLFLAVSFMASFFLLRWQENEFTIGFYTFAASWTGIFINVLLAMGLCWLSIGVLRIAGKSPNTRLIAAVWLILAVLYSTYGVWNAFHPRIKSITVNFDNLPDQWKGKTVVQLSDVHLGHIHGQRFLKRIISKVTAAKPEMIFITGDLFDGMDASISDSIGPLNDLSAPQGVYFISGNHETYVGLRPALDVIHQTNIRVLHNEIIDVGGLQIIGISYPGIRGPEDIRGLDKFGQTSSESAPRILLFHTPTSIYLKGDDEFGRHFSTYWMPDTSFRQHKRLGVDLQLSGHSHAGQIVPFGFLTKLIYSGFDYGLHEPNGLTVYTTSGVGTWGPPMRTGNSPEIVAITLQ